MLKPLFHLLVYAGTLLGLVLCGYLDVLNGAARGFLFPAVLMVVLDAWFNPPMVSFTMPLLASAVALIWEAWGRGGGPITGVDFWNFTDRFLMLTGVNLLTYVASFYHNRFKSGAVFDNGLMSEADFHHQLEDEIQRLTRYGRRFTLSQIHIDPYEELKKEWKESEVQFLESAITHLIRSSIRATDRLTPLGNGEYVILFPETEQEAILALLEKIKALLSKSAESSVKPWEVSFSVVTMTFFKAPAGSAEVMDILGQTMKRALKNGNGTMIFETYP